MTALALGNRKVVGLRWFAACMIAGLAKTLLQSQIGHAPAALTVFGANEVNCFAFFAMYLGFRWFLVRKPLQGDPVAIVVVVAMLGYAGARFAGVWWQFIVSMVPVFASCLGIVSLMLRRASRQFQMAARATSFFFALQIAVGCYRTVFITQSMIHAHGGPPVRMVDPRWNVTMMALMVLDSCFVGSFLWFYVIELQSKLRHQSRTDDLTGALNRRAIDLEAEREIARANRSLQPLSLIVLDIDHFKRLNDSRGHAAGDFALQRLVILLSDQLRAQDLVARTGGEEFLLLLPDTPLFYARQVAERLRGAIERQASSFDGSPLCVTASLGVAEYKLRSLDSWDEVRHRGDMAMYEAKQTGRNRVAMHLCEGQTAELIGPARVAAPRAIGSEQLRRQSGSSPAVA